jgi:hypothetical protein
VLLTAKYLPRLARAAGGDPRVAVWLGIANPLVLVHFVAGGHNDALMVGLLVAGLTIAIEATEERWVALGVVVCSAAVLVMAPAALAVAFLAWAWAKHLTGRAVLLRACVRTGVVALVTIAVLTAVTGLGFGWIDQLNASGQVVAWTSIPTGIGMLIETVRHVPNFVTYQDPVIAGFRLGGQVATALVLLWLWLRSGPADWVRTTGLALLVVVVLGPVVQPWYVLWGLSLLAATRLDRRIGLIAAGACFWLSMMITPQGSAMFLEVAPVIATAVAAAVATLAVLGRSPDEADEVELPGGASPEPVNARAVASPAVNGRDLEEPVASVP